MRYSHLIFWCHSSIHPSQDCQKASSYDCTAGTQYNPKVSETILHIRDCSLEDLQEKLGSQKNTKPYLHSVTFGYFHGPSYELYADCNLVPPSTTLSGPNLAQGQAEGLRNNDSSKRGRGEKRKEIWVAHVEWKERGNTHMIRVRQAGNREIQNGGSEWMAHRVAVARGGLRGTKQQCKHKPGS